MENNEPALTSSTITSIVAAVIALLVSFSLPLSAEQQVAITSLVAVLAPFLSGYLTRRKVTPSKNVAVVVDSDHNYRAADAHPAPNGTRIGLI